MLPDGQGVVQAVLRECNWLQALEGDIDTSHLGFLHHGSKTVADYRPGTFAYYAVHDRAPRYQVVDTDYGAMYAAYRPAGDGQAITESMGPIYDRGSEHLGTSDVMVIRVRRRLMQAARALAEEGITPAGVEHPDAYRVRSGGCFQPEGADWLEATADLRRAFVEHPDLDPAISGGQA